MNQFYYVVLRRSKLNPHKLKVIFNGTSSTDKLFTEHHKAQLHAERMSKAHGKNYTFEVVTLTA